MITFTEEQQKIVDYIFEQIDLGSNGKNIVISGQGGVGKTEMITEVICILLDMGKRVAVSAMTGKATAVLRNKIHKKLFDKKMIFYDENGKAQTTFPKGNLYIETIQKLTKQSKVVDINDNGTTVYSNTWKKPQEFNYDILVIDELSMVPQYVSLWWQRTNALIIGLGDFCQLPEVTTDESQKELSGFRHDLGIDTGKMVHGYGIKVLKDLSQCHLTKVLRSDNEIALLSNDLRDFKQSNRYIVDKIKEWSNKAPNTIEYANNLNELETSSDWQIICYTNKLCSEINEALCLGGDYPILEDKILLYDNIAPIQKFNGDTMLLNDLLTAVKVYNSDPKRMRSPITVILKWNNKMPSINSPYRLEREMARQYLQFKSSLKLAQILRLESLNSILDKSGYSKIQIEEWKKDIENIRKEIEDPGECFLKIIERFNEVDIDMAEIIMNNAPQLPRMYILGIGYGYAITTHKAQGSEYENVCYILEKFDKPLLYTGVSRAKKKLKVINLTGTT